MKKLLIGSVIFVALVSALVTAGVVYAQTQFPPTQPENGWGMGRMMSRFGITQNENMWNHMQGNGMMGAYGGFMMNGQYGIMHESMVAALAEKLGISVEDLNTAIADGKTMWQVAEDEGLSSDEITTLMQDAHTAAIEAAVEDGILTTEQAEQMNTQMQLRLNGDGPFAGHCTGNTQD